MTPHVSGSTLSAQARYAAGTREILECWFDGRPIRQEYLIVDGGGLAGTGARSYTVAVTGVPPRSPDDENCRGQGFISGFRGRSTFACREASPCPL